MRRVEVSSEAKNAGDVGNLISRESWEIYNADFPLKDQMVLSSRSEKILTLKQLKKRVFVVLFCFRVFKIFFVAIFGFCFLFYMC